MLKHIHQLIIEPGSTVKMLCKDGLSAATVYNIDKIYHFGGKFEFKDCGAGAIYAGLTQALDSVQDKYLNNNFKFHVTPDYPPPKNCDTFKPKDFPDHKTFSNTVDLCRAYV